MTDDRVRFTDDQAAWSKASCVKRGYWKDEGLIRCIPKGPRRSPIIHAMYFMRHKLVDTTLKSVIESKKVNQILILGAGTDTSFWRLEMAKRPEIRWFEIDFPHNLKAKQILMEEHFGTAVNYYPVPSDLRKMAEVEKSLKASSFDFDSPTFVLSEVVLAYLTDKYSTKCINWISQSLKNCFFVEFEQFQPFSSFGRVMTSHFEKLGSPLKTIKQLPTLESRRRRLAEANFHHKVLPFIDVQLELPNLEPFDEFEALHTVMKHYYVGFSTNCSFFEDIIDQIFESLKISKTTTEIVQTEATWKVADRSEQVGQAFGAMVEDDIVGGMGTGEKRVDISPEIYGTQSAQSIVLNNSTLIYGGRRSPHKPNSKWCINGTQIDFEENLLLNVYRAAVTSAGDCGYQFGGRLIEGKFTNRLIKIEQKSEQLCATEIPAVGEHLPSLASATITERDGFLYIIGGLLEIGAISNTVFKVKVGMSYEIVEKIELKFGIYGHQAISCDSILLVGGVSTLACNDDYVYQFNPSTGEIIIESIDFGTDIVITHGHHLNGSKNELRIIGGGNNCFSFGTHLNRKFTVLKRD